MTGVLEAKSLTVRRSGNTVLNGISFSVSQGTTYALLGGNGAGKSTTLLTFLGFLTPDSGSVKVLEKDVQSNLKHVRSQIAYLPESATLYPHLNAFENLKYFLSLGGISADVKTLDDALERVGLKLDSRDKRLQTYSKGMRQKVAIALSLLRNTPVLLLDEPTSGLDPLAIDEFNALVTSLANDGKSILMVTHDVYGACQVADKIGLLQNGSLVGEFERENDGLIDTDTVHAAFAGRTVVESNVAGSTAK